MDTDTIAWLVPSCGNRLALQATQMPQNAPLRTTSPLSDSSGPALRLSFSQTPASYRGFLIGTDPACDVVLPKSPGISRRHAHLTFDADSRLVLRDTSRNGTAVWYDHRSNGDRTDFCWVLSSGFAYGFPDQVGRIVIDVQGVRFRVVVNGPGADVEGYVRRVDDFLVGLAERADAPVAPQLGGRGGEGGFVKHTVEGDGEGPRTFLWSVARPWDPIIPLTEY
ncbi:hypothetical protein VUR80DRAFT_5811 [Thermomyces stellatus]